MEWLRNQNIDVMNWPSLSPDLNPMENIWAQVARHVYRNGRQFENVNDLRQAIIHAWNEIDENLLTDLCSSMSNRIYNVIRSRGGHSGY